ncbi:MAG: type II toxin-antitoxin system RelE/ParE family toxin [Bacteroidales bacterium]|nr:type II toxin-antitoxin system RelE/ParE family toxin [Bacteroidales bacterium]
MEEGVSCKPFEVSEKFDKSRLHIYEYSLETFGYFQAERYLAKVRKSLDTLPRFHNAYPECRHIPTKSQMYRNIVLDAHLIIYRITKQHIEVLDIVHSASSVSKIRSTRKIHI